MEETEILPRPFVGAGLWWSIAAGSLSTLVFVALSLTTAVTFALAAWLALTITAVVAARAAAFYTHRSHLLVATTIGSTGVILGLCTSGWAWLMEQDSAALSEVADRDLTGLLTISLLVAGLSISALIVIIIWGTSASARLRRSAIS